MDEQDWLSERFEQQRTRLRSVAYRMLGSVSDAEDAVQDAWIRVSSARTDEIAVMLDKSPEATRQLASRARRRVQGAASPPPAHDLPRERKIVDAFFAAARDGDFAALVEVLHPDVVLYPDFGASRRESLQEVHGAAAVAGQAVRFAHPATLLRPVLVNGAVGVVVSIDGKPLSIMGFTVADEVITAIHAIADPARVRAILEAEAAL